MKQKTKTGMFNPIIIFFLVSAMSLTNYIFPPDMRFFPQRIWYPAEDSLQILIIATCAGYLGIAFGRILTLNPRVKLNVSQASANAKIIHRFGNLLFYISCIGYLIWILFDFQGWVNYQATGHLKTIAGVTTTTQFLCVSVVCLFTARLLGCVDTTQKKKILFGIILTLIRSQQNHERLALLELLLPLLIVRLMWTDYKFRVRPMLTYSGFAIGLYLFFSANEYFRSWQFYRLKIEINFFIFTFHRLLDYYATSLNNGVIYINNRTEISNLPIASLDFVWNFPVLGPFLLEKLQVNESNLSWSQVLKIVAGTDEFNNLHSYLALYSDFGIVGMFLVLFLITLIFSILYYKIVGGEFSYVVSYAIATVGIIELPRFFWFGSGRAFPIIISLMILQFLLRKSRLH